MHGGSGYHLQHPGQHGHHDQSGHLSSVTLNRLDDRQPVVAGKNKIFSISRNVQNKPQQPLLASDVKYVNTSRGKRGPDKHNQIHV